MSEVLKLGEVLYGEECYRQKIQQLTQPNGTWLFYEARPMTLLQAELMTGYRGGKTRAKSRVWRILHVFQAERTGGLCVREGVRDVRSWPQSSLSLSGSYVCFHCAESFKNSLI